MLPSGRILQLEYSTMILRKSLLLLYVLTTLKFIATTFADEPTCKSFYSVLYSSEVILRVFFVVLWQSYVVVEADSLWHI